MITAFVGTLDDETNTSIRGNGKTCSMTGLGYLNYLKKYPIWSNYETDFSDEVIGLQTMIDKIGTEPHENLQLLVTEMQQILNSIGSTTDQVLFIDMFCSQIRKLDIDLSYDSQRFNNIHKRLRIHTDIIFQPIKTHMDNSICNYDRCKAPHKIYLYCLKPRQRVNKWKCIFDASAVGKHYNSQDIIFDKLNIPSKKKVRA